MLSPHPVTPRAWDARGSINSPALAFNGADWKQVRVPKCQRETSRTASAVTLGLEGLWVSIDQDDDSTRPTGTFTPVGGAPVNVFLPRSNDEQDFFVARAKLNFKFGTY